MLKILCFSSEFYSFNENDYSKWPNYEWTSNTILLLYWIPTVQILTLNENPSRRIPTVVCWVQKWKFWSGWLRTFLADLHSLMMAKWKCWLKLILTTKNGSLQWMVMWIAACLGASEFNRKMHELQIFSAILSSNAAELTNFSKEW